MKNALYTLLLLVLVGCGSCSKSQAEEKPDNHFIYTHERYYGWAGSLREFRDEEHKVTCWTIQYGNNPGISCLRDP